MNLEVIRFKQYGLPINMISQTWEHTGLAKPEATRLENLFNNIPAAAKLIFVQGTAGPIVNQLLSVGHKVRGIDMGVRFNTPFEEANNPQCDIVVIYNLDNTVSVPKITVPMIKGLVEYYRHSGTLVIIQSHETVTIFEANYGIKVVNKLKIPEAQEVKWL